LLSIAAGATPGTYLTSKDFTEEGPRRTLLLALERDWPVYLALTDTDVADFLIAETTKTFSRH